MDEELKQMIAQIQAANAGTVVPDQDQPTVEDYAQMEAPRGDYSAQPSKFENVRKLMGQMNNTVTENAIPEPFRPEHTVYAGDAKAPSIAEQRNISIQNAIRDPNLNARPRINRLLGR